MKVEGKDYRTIWMERDRVFMIEQNLLPFRFSIHECNDFRETCDAIRNMTVRGAGAIGAAAAFAMAQAFISLSGEQALRNAKELIEGTRPTARNLFYAVDEVWKAGLRSPEEAISAALSIADKDAEDSRSIGAFGEPLIKENFRIATHCNAGWLAFVDFGTALSPIYKAFENGKNIFVYVDETRPRGQGARLTAWELENEGIPHAIIPDNATAWYMARGKIDMMIVGADRIASNGDVANKIGTLEKAVAAHHFGIPFYVAAPTSTFDLTCKTGSEISIEERSEDEVLYQEGPDINGVMRKIRIASPGSSALNPAFDVTPAALVSGIITEKGMINAHPREIALLFAG